MERYYTIPMEIGLYTTPGIDVIRSTSFYGLTFVRVSFKYGVDYNFAYSRPRSAAECHSAGTTSPAYPAIARPARSSLPGERAGAFWNDQSPHRAGLDRRQALRRFPASCVNSWGGTTKEFDVEVDPHKLEAYNITVPQILTALGNANINVGGREITIGQQSINIRGIGLIDDGGDDDLTQGYKVSDIENVVLGQSNGVPVRVKDVAKVTVGYVPRLGIAGRDHDDDIVSASSSWGAPTRPATCCRHQGRDRRMNSDGSLPPGVKIVPFYDRRSLVSVTTHTVLHNLVFGCLLIFLIQWIFLGDLRSALIVGVEHSLRAGVRDDHVGAARRKRQPAFSRRGGLRHHRRFGGDPGREYFPEFPKSPEERQRLLERLAEAFGARTPPARRTARRRADVDGPSAADPDQRAAGGQGGVLLRADHRGRLRAAVHHAGRGGADFRPDGAHLRLCFGGRARSRPSPLRRCWRRCCCPTSGRNRDLYRAHAAPSIRRRCAGRSTTARSWWRSGWCSCRGPARWRRGWAAIPAGAGGRQLLDPRVDAADHGAEDGAPRRHARCARSCCAIRKSSPWCRSTDGRTTAAMPRRSPTSNCSCRSSRSTNGRRD